MKNIGAIVPIKPLHRSKSRLSPVLNSQQREALSRQMLEQTLQTLKRVEDISGVLVVSRDPAALALARRMGVNTLQESGAPELNSSLMRATQVAAAWNAVGVLVVASDIPLMQAEDIAAMIDMAIYPPTMVIAPDRHRTGTNALLMAPPALFPFQFGEGSFQKHISEAKRSGATVHIYESPTIEFDLDTPSDLILYRELLAQRELNEPAWMGG